MCSYPSNNVILFLRQLNWAKTPKGLCMVESMHKLSLRAAMRCPSTSHRDPSILIKWQLWQSSRKARNNPRIFQSIFSPCATTEQHTWPSPGLESWQGRWEYPAWRTGVFPGQSVLLRGKEGPAAEGSLGRHLGGTLEQRPDGEWSPGWRQKHSGSGRGSPCGNKPQHTWEQHKISRYALW